MQVDRISLVQLLVTWCLVGALGLDCVQCWQVGPGYLDPQALAVLNSGSPIGGGDHYLLLSDDEILHNGDLLNELVATNKDDIEEIMGDSPELQAALLNKVKSVVKLKSKQTNGQNNLAQSFGFPVAAAGPAAIVPAVGAYGNSLANTANNPQLAKLKKKLLNKTAKLVKISAPLKTKIVSMLLKKLKKKLKKMKKLKMKLGQQQQPGIPKLPGVPAALPGTGVGGGKLEAQAGARPSWHVSFSGSG